MDILVVYSRNRILNGSFEIRIKNDRTVTFERRIIIIITRVFLNAYNITLHDEIIKKHLKSFNRLFRYLPKNIYIYIYKTTVKSSNLHARTLFSSEL